MQTYLFYTRQTAGENRMTELAERLRRRGVTAELVDADSQRGIELVELYGLVIRPAVIVIRTDGQMVQMWADQEQLLTVDDISYFAHL